ncbi:hypothetical protein ACIQ6K_18730, partial [Streptomyces sp. NPDC096354]|uniref:hypothetical protein n=1 Tax=Streptomyces sp. NPDC096354 TaxID=3366088 RepID=UPI0038085AE6
MTFVAQGGSTMGEEPTWPELLLTFALVGAIPVVIGGIVIFSLVGLTMWVTARSRPLEWCIDGHSVISFLRLCGEFGREDGVVG